LLPLALGADRGVVIRMVLREALMLTAAGLAIGLPAAVLAFRVETAANPVGVRATDPAIVGGALLAMLIAGLCAGVVPAVRASRVDPAMALRHG
jgi:ABC-type antimicrobial peptide transport system permease subunit